MVPGVFLHLARNNSGSGNALSSANRHRRSCRSRSSSPTSSTFLVWTRPNGLTFLLNYHLTAADIDASDMTDVERRFGSAES
jgi:hypothetical protein